MLFWDKTETFKNWSWDWPHVLQHYMFAFLSFLLINLTRSCNIQAFNLPTHVFCIFYLPPCVSDSPSILPSSFCSITDGTLRCVCQADANPNAVISWTVDGSSALFPSYNTSTQRSGSMMVSELTGPKSHNVICTATNDVATEIKQIHVHSEGTVQFGVVWKQTQTRVWCLC